jgi:murein L,D-transpeptidase YcbB/YkuD
MPRIPRRAASPQGPAAGRPQEIRRAAAGLRMACLLLLGGLCAALGCAGPAAQPPAPPSPEALRSGIAQALAAPETERLEPELLAEFYARRGQQPAFVDPAGPQLRARRLLDALDTASEHGLRPDTYHTGQLARLLAAGPASVADLAELDLLAADGFLHLARHLSCGAVDPQTLHPGYAREPVPDLVGALEAALSGDDPAAGLAKLAPPHPEYAHLMRAFARLRDAGPEAEAPAADAPGTQPTPTRAERIRANLERWRWLPHELGERHLRVNVAEFRLRAFEAGAVRLEQPVVVGCGGWETPPTHGVIRYLVLNPAWDVPRSIAVREMLPAEQRDPDYLDRLGIQVLGRDASGALRELNPGQIDWQALDADHFPYRLRQPPGPQNPLGRIKFAFPNPYGIWLHGTPGRAAFERPMRNLSHGCVRVEDEIGLALFTLAPDPTWTRARLLEALDAKTQEVVRLPEPLPVHVLYLTVAADAEGNASFGNDPYAWDPALVAALPPGPDPPGAGS